MLLIKYDGRYSYSVNSLMGLDYKSYSWLLYTICLLYMIKYKRKLASRYDFNSDYIVAFIIAILSEEFIE
jgi:hypothetical protein